MAPAPDSLGDDAWTAAIVAAALKRGAMIHSVSMAATLIVAIILIGTTAGFFRLPVGALWFGAAFLLGAIEFWLAARVAFDADLFAALARHSDTDGFDRAMLALGLMPASKAGRPMMARGQGALRLLKLQTLVLGLQIIGLLLAALVAALSRLP